MSIEDGYAIQRAWVALELAEGRVVKGRKIGLTSRAMQQSSQIDEPDFAPLMDDMFFTSGSDIPVSRFIAPRIEVELAFILGKPLKGPGVTLFDVLSATEWVSPAIEIIDARIEQFDRDTKAPRKVFDTISDFAANAGIVLGGRPVKPTPWTCRWVRCCSRTASKKPAWPPRCSPTRPTAAPGWPTGSRPTTSSSMPAR